MEKCNKVFEVLAIFGLSVLTISLTAEVAASTSTEFSATIAYEGACDISAPPTIVFNNGNDVLPSDIESGASTAIKTFDLTLTDCKGVNVTPKIRIAGESNANTGESLFLDTAASDATGYGIKLATVGNANFKANPNLAVMKAISVIDEWDLKTQLTALNGSIPMTATLSCGDCDTDGRLGGELKANVIFEFVYE